jgi:hypothetical protein
MFSLLIRVGNCAKILSKESNNVLISKLVDPFSGESKKV